MPRIICAGLIAADLVFDVPAFPVKGTKNRATASRMITGGGALNAASAIAGLGGDSALAGGIGDDIFGAFLRQKMAASAACTSAARLQERFRWRRWISSHGVFRRLVRRGA